ncbi:MAG: divalent-cation tolerance protein CutA [Puniceicoccaceae bacterium]
MDGERIVVGWTTVETGEQAENLAGNLIRERLAACVQIDAPIRSHYRWGGSACADSEIRIWIKTTPEKVAGICAFFEKSHPYDVPQWVWTSASASAPYAAWVDETTRTDGAGH